MADFVPAGDEPLLGFANNYSTLITAGPTAVGLTAPIASTLAGLVSAFETKLDALDNPENRNPVGIFEKNQARADLVAYIRTTARQIQGTMTVTDLQRTQLRLPVRDTEGTPVELLDEAPALTILRIFGHNVHVRVRDASGERRGKPSNADGCAIFSFVGATPPDGYQGWTSEGVITKDNVIVALPEDLAEGTKVFVTAAWYNTRGMGPGCTPVALVVGAEGSLSA